MNPLFLSLQTKLGTVYRKGITKEFLLQGHNLTGKAANSIQDYTKDIPEGFMITVEMVTYGAIVNKGVTPARIPYGESRGGTSKYIEGLKRYVMKRMRVNAKKALGIAFAIAKKQKQEGMSTFKSRRFSKTGKRQNFVLEAARKVEAEASRILIEQTNLLLTKIILE